MLYPFDTRSGGRQLSSRLLSSSQVEIEAQLLSHVSMERRTQHLLKRVEGEGRRHLLCFPLRRGLLDPSRRSFLDADARGRRNRRRLHKAPISARASRLLLRLRRSSRGGHGADAVALDGAGRGRGRRGGLGQRLGLDVGEGGENWVAK